MATYIGGTFGQLGSDPVCRQDKDACGKFGSGRERDDIRHRLSPPPPLSTSLPSLSSSFDSLPLTTYSMLKKIKLPSVCLSLHYVVDVCMTVCMWVCGCFLIYSGGAI